MFLCFSKKYLVLVAMAIIIRPTALIVWLPLFAYHFYLEYGKLRLITHCCIPIGLVILTLSTHTSYHFFHLPTCTFTAFLTRRAFTFVSSTVIDCLFYGQVKKKKTKQRYLSVASTSPYLKWCMSNNCTLLHSVVDAGAVQLPQV